LDGIPVLTVRIATALALVAIAALGHAALGQQASFRTTTQLVIAPVTVKDSAGNFVDGLTAGQFELLDNGVIRPVQADNLYVPISLVVAVQTNTNAAAALAKIRKIGPLFEPLVIGEHGEAAVVTYDDEVKVALPFTKDAKALKPAFLGLPAGGGNARMVDAVERGVQLLEERGVSGRRVLIVIGESRDRGSKAQLEDVVTLAQRENVAIYPVVFSVHLTPWTARPEELPMAGNFNLFAIFAEIGRLGKTNGAMALSRYTGGRELSFAKQHGLEQVISEIGAELHSQYLLSFTPSGAVKDEFHRIEVSVKGRDDLKITTRPGYWITDSPR
jgi:VWFA-related protein